MFRTRGGNWLGPWPPERLTQAVGGVVPSTYKRRCHLGRKQASVVCREQARLGSSQLTNGIMVLSEAFRLCCALFQCCLLKKHCQ